MRRPAARRVTSAGAYRVCSTFERWVWPVAKPARRSLRAAVAACTLVIVAACRVSGQSEAPSRSAPDPSRGGASAAAELPDDFVPSAVAFWTAAEGLLVGTAGCPERCEGVVARTRDGGRTWQVVHRGGNRVWDVATVSGGRAWATVSSCGHVGDTNCARSLLRTDDGGHAWRSVDEGEVSRVSGRSLAAPSFADPQHGWSLPPDPPEPEEPAGLLASADGGKTWRPVPAPCESKWHEPAGVSFPAPRTGWLVCAGQPGAGQQMKALYRTDDGGRTWELVRDLSGAGYVDGVFFRPEGRGWVWMSRGSLLATADGGRDWEVLDVASPEVIEARSVWFISETEGFAVLQDNERRVWRLDATRDAGKTWSVVRTWPADAP